MSSVFPVIQELVPEPLSKKMRLDEGKSSKIIGTHNGTFHCDEALAVFMLRQTNDFRNSDVKRSRDPAILNACDIVVDVGGVYDDSKRRYDHHQRGFTEVFGHGFETKLSSAGLVYKHFGKEIIADRLQSPQDDPRVETLWLKVYKEFIEAVDGIDNGVSQYPAELKPKYRVRTDLSSRVGWLNPAWNEASDSQSYDTRFERASSLTGQEFLSRLDYYANAWLPARSLVAAALAARTSTDPSGNLIIFESFLPWKEHLFELEEEQSVAPDAQPIYVIYPDESGKWRVQAVPVSPDSFESRKALPQAWRGLRDEELSKASGVEGCIFVHASGFIGGAQTQEGALKLAKLALTL
ncbi:metal-dependent protein hydrolase [Punctularia strigosozonata HHB-11173 SS5]|uniref:metal-dependent protein hydrolase n=1 Tax=Punctularia strigosozonata (strain HHB-11173) TaxID=741275 RepID=UPI0004416964|nr:metal-dependent protein hydrolase [Punctularia strigosozonata HHB-11173 SS5]EIN13719.1 metal-dependent protein hydrolase [Punctularia strigosozonata HHB-11173 SS5]